MAIRREAAPEPPARASDLLAESGSTVAIMPGTEGLGDPPSGGMEQGTLIHQDALVRIFRAHDRPGVRIVGEIDLSNAASLTGALEAVAERPHVTIDLSACSHLGSAGIGAIIEVWQRGGVEITIADPSPTIHRAIEISGITRFAGITLQ